MFRYSPLVQPGRPAHGAGGSMSAIAGIVDLSGTEPLPAAALRRMAHALRHRGPDREAFHEEPGVGLAYRGLDPAGPGEAHGPCTSEDGSVVAVCHGRFYNRDNLHQDLAGRGYRLRTGCEAELLAHLWEDQG